MTTKEKMMMEQTSEIVCDMIKKTHFYENDKKEKEIRRTFKNQNK